MTPTKPGPETPARPGADLDVFRVEVSCPECGAPVGFGEEDLTVTCQYCDSLLSIDTQGKEPCYFLSNQLQDPGRLRATLAAYQAGLRRPEFAQAYRGDDNCSPIPEWLVDEQVRRLEERFLASIELTDVQIVHVPYRLGLGELGQGVVGRGPGGNKTTSFRVYSLEYTLRGYPSLMSFRDRGLKIQVGALKLLTRAQASSLPGRFLLEDASLEPPLHHADRLLRQSHDPELENTAPPQSALLFFHQSTVYRPYLLVDYRLEGRSRATLVDGSTGLVAGKPSHQECASLLASDAFGDPLAHHAEARVEVLASECPDCGNEQVFDRRARYQLCSVCRRALEIRADGIHTHRYVYADEQSQTDTKDHVFVPFWRFGFSLETADGRLLQSPAELLQALYDGLPVESRAGKHLFVPAIRCLGHPRLDADFAWLAWAATHEPRPHFHSGPLLPDAPGGHLTATLDKDEARQIAPLLLYGLLDKARRARLTRHKAASHLAGARLHLERPKLALIPFPLADDALRLGKLDGQQRTANMYHLLRAGASLGLVERIRVSIGGISVSRPRRPRETGSRHKNKGRMQTIGRFGW